MAYKSEVHPDPERAARGRRRRRKNRHQADLGVFPAINWDHYHHYELYDMIMSARPVPMGQQAVKWRKLGRAIKETTDEVKKTLDELLGTWHGTAAVRAAESSTELAQWADTASQTAKEIGAGLVKYTDAVERAQREMPPPEFATAEQRFLEGYDVKGSGGPSTAILIRQLLDDQKPNFDKQEAAKAEAVRVMQVYGTQSQDVHDTVPRFYDAPTLPDQPPPDAPPTQGPGPGGGPRPEENPSGTLGTDDGTTAAGFADPAYGPGGFPPGQG
ncbi:MAG TPA: PPE domain-containing protein, partial [Actinophytocola sp.]|uniref:PPE domain-containing protein n=1 Tax=Actinophytocola sp. TaxID=1872138 RepID=UPI002DDD0DD9